MQPTLPQMDKKLDTEEITPALIRYITDKIVREIKPEKIILFGSFARGDARKDSDLDLFVVNNGDSENETIRRQIETLLWGRKFGLDLLVRKPEEVAWNFRAKNTFYTKHIFKDGKILYENS
jgi:predicted nucleotidyltransferase